MSFKAAAEEVQQKWAKMLKQEIASIYIKRANRHTILREVVKYTVKGSDLAECTGSPAALIRAIDGTRLLTTFGSVFGIGKTIERRKWEPKQDPNDPDSELEEVGRNCCGTPSLLPLECFDAMMNSSRGVRR